MLRGHCTLYCVSWTESTQLSLFRLWALTHLSSTLKQISQNNACSTWHWWMGTSTLLPTVGSPWIIPPAKPDLSFPFPFLGMTFTTQHLPRSTASASSHPPFPPAPPTVNSCSVWHARVWEEWLELPLQNWLGQTEALMSIVQRGSKSAERFRKRDEFLDVSLPEWPEVSMWPYLSLHCLDSKSMGKLPVNNLLWKPLNPLNQFGILKVTFTFAFKVSLPRDT